MKPFENGSMIQEAREVKPLRFDRNGIKSYLLVILEIIVVVLVLLTLAVFVVLRMNLAEAQKYSLFEIISKTNSSERGFLFYLFSNIAYIGICVSFCRFVEKRSLKSMGFRGGVVPNYLRGFLLGIAVICLAVIIAVFLGGLRFKTSTELDIGFLLIVLFGYMIQGMAEEVVVHGFLMMSLTNRLPLIAAIIVSSVMFSAFHAMNPSINFLALFNLFLFGTFEAFYILRTDNIWGAAAFHTAWNFIQGNVFGIRVSGNILSTSVFEAEQISEKRILHGGEFGIEGSIFTTFILIMLIVSILFAQNIKFSAVTKIEKKKRSKNYD